MKIIIDKTSGYRDRMLSGAHLCELARLAEKNQTPRKKKRSGPNLPNLRSNNIDLSNELGPQYSSVAFVNTFKTTTSYIGIDHSSTKMPTVYYAPRAKQYPHRRVVVIPYSTVSASRWKSYVIDLEQGGLVNAGPVNGAVLESYVSNKFAAHGQNDFHTEIRHSMNLRVDDDGNLPDHMKSGRVTFIYAYPDRNIRIYISMNQYEESLVDDEFSITWKSASVGVGKLDRRISEMKVLTTDVWGKTCPGLVLDLTKPFPMTEQDLLLSLFMK